MQKDQNTKDIIEYLKKSRYYKAPKQKINHQDVFLGDDPSGYKQIIEKIPDLRTKENAEDLINQLDHKLDELKQKNDKEGIKHLILIAELARTKTKLKGFPDPYRELTKWIEKQKRI